MDFKISLRAARVNAEMEVEEAAKKLGISRTTLWSYETGATEPKRDMIRRMCDLYRVPLEMLNY